jgi:hypothetical protein
MLNSQFLTSVGFDIGKSIVATVGAKAIDLDAKLDYSKYGAIPRHASNGTINFITSETIDLVSGAPSKLRNMDWVGAVDEVLFFSMLSGAFEVVGVDGGLFKFVKDSLGLDRKNAEIVTESTLLSGSRVASRILEASDDIPPMLKNIRHPVRTLLATR